MNEPGLMKRKEVPEMEITMSDQMGKVRQCLDFLTWMLLLR